MLITCTTCDHQQNNLRFNGCQYLLGIEDADRLKCGSLEVPEDHEIPGSRKIQLAFVIIGSRDTSANNYPMIHFTGGPGAATLTTGRIKQYMQSDISQDRDVILFDQRGIGQSSPLPDLSPTIFSIMADDLDIVEEEEQIAALMQQVKKECEDSGIDLAKYNSYQNAKDAGLLMHILGYEKYNLSGGSYGTRLARIVMEEFPELVHTAILNSPNPPGGDFLIDRLQSYSTALSQIFQYCGANPECDLNYPSLESEYLNTISELGQNPIAVETSFGKFIINPQDALYLLRRQLYRTNSRTHAPALIRELATGEDEIIKEIIESEFAFNEQYNFSMWISVERYETIRLENTPDAIEKVYQSLHHFPTYLGLFNSVYHSAKNWHGSTATQEELSLEFTDIPTLIFVNQYDPVTPPVYGHLMCEKISTCRLLVLDEGGHGGGNESCRTKAIRDFMSDPDRELNTSCLNLYAGGGK